MRQLMHRGVRVTVNSDDPAYFRGYIKENVLKMVEDGHMELKDIITLQRNAFNIAWISQASRDYYLEKLEAFASAAVIG